MTSTSVLIILAIVVFLITVAFVILTVRNPKGKIELSGNGNGLFVASEHSADDIRSKTTKCHRCGHKAFGVLGTENIYRCQTCGSRTQGPAFVSMPRAEAESGAPEQLRTAVSGR